VGTVLIGSESEALALILKCWKKKQGIKRAIQKKEGILLIFEKHIVQLNTMKEFATHLFTKCGPNVGLAEVESIGRSSMRTFFQCQENEDEDDDEKVMKDNVYANEVAYGDVGANG